MAMRSMTPSRGVVKGIPINRGREVRPIDAIRRDVSRLFDDFFSGFNLWPSSERADSFGSFMPQVDMTEDEKSIRINAELPGLDEKDIEISVTDDALTIKGEKKEESEHEGEDVYCTERTYGSFTRVLPIPKQVIVDKVEATFKKGVLNITLPKSENEQHSRRKVEIKTH
ncbi:MAG TPA: Hsp20/alpha crystallin family protein [Desulfomonilia bacterium]|nr:Hsp20/alpha crystallin family protein [Desulfomonilia bacterium]